MRRSSRSLARKTSRVPRKKPAGTSRSARSAAAPAGRKRSPASPATPPPIKIATVSHTLDAALAQRLRTFAFHEKMSESAVIEYALRALLETDDDAALGRRLRKAGAGLRRRA
jgi:predicted transcriptional regulator